MKKTVLLALAGLFTSVVTAQSTTVYFNTGSYQPEAGELKKIEALVKDFSASGYASVQVTGYADTTSNWAFNLDLSQKRAQRIKALLIEKGIPEESVCTRHKGEASGGKDLKLDRKAEIVLDKKELGLAQLFQEQDVEKQYYSFDPLRDNEIKCKAGTVLQIPKDCFVDEKGNPIKTPINLQVQEYYNLGDYIKAGLFTVSNGKLLQSGGVVNIHATTKGKPVVFGPGMKVAIGFNTAADQDMKAFMGNVSERGVSWFEDILSQTPCKQQGSPEIWVKDSVLMYETNENGKHMTVDTTETFKTYRFIDRKVPTVFVNRFGFINCDKFLNDPTAVEMEISVDLLSMADEPETSVYLIFQKTMSVLPLQRKTDENKKVSFHSPYMKMPYGSMAHVVAVSKTGKKFYYGSDALELTGSQGIKLRVLYSSMQKIKTAMAVYAMN